MYVSPLCSLEEKIKDLKEMYEEREKNPEVHKVDSLVPVQKNLSAEFNKHKRELVSMIGCVYNSQNFELYNINIMFYFYDYFLH
jgi:hypothetical protein